VFRLWTDKENLEIDAIEKRRKREENELQRLNQKHAFRELKEETKNTQIVAHVRI